jgi:hypothetical protein
MTRPRKCGAFFLRLWKQLQYKESEDLSMRRLRPGFLSKVLSLLNAWTFAAW